MDQGAYERGIRLRFIAPGKPGAERLHRIRQRRAAPGTAQRLLVLSLADARTRMEAWRKEDNEDRPHTALKNPSLKEYQEQAQRPVKVA